MAPCPASDVEHPSAGRKTAQALAREACTPHIGLVAVAVLTFLLSWIPPRLEVWRRDRDVARLQRRVAELEQHVPNYDLHPTPVVIPDRAPQAPPHDTALSFWAASSTPGTRHPGR